jgi:ectoine hydroxylase-related dioxygenase (phytanoyl-CoA dioxygenase family)
MAIDVELKRDYEVINEQSASFQKNGHMILRGVAEAGEVALYRGAIGEIVQEHAKKYMPIEQRDTYGKAFIQIGNLWTKSEQVKKFVLARRFAKIAADLMGVDGVRIYHDQALFKEPGGGHTPWHQDQVYWPLDTLNTITLWMPLVNIPAEVGSMTFASGTHQHGYISKTTISDESHSNFASYVEAKQIPTVNYGAMQAGDATFHYGWTLHSAPGNPTALMREVMTIIYVADGSVVAEPDSNARRKDMENWFPGLKPGDLAASPLNPLVYSRTSHI